MVKKDPVGLGSINCWFQHVFSRFANADMLLRLVFGAIMMLFIADISHNSEVTSSWRPAVTVCRTILLPALRGGGSKRCEDTDEELVATGDFIHVSTINPNSCFISFLMVIASATSAA